MFDMSGMTRLPGHVHSMEGLGVTWFLAEEVAMEELPILWISVVVVVKAATRT